jgi:hypothetical protein
MYRWLRGTHLSLGAFCCAFLLMYGVSALQMAHFNLRPAVTETTIALRADGAADARAVARQLMERGAVRGVLRNVTATDDGFRFRVERMGVAHQVTWSRTRGEAHIRTQDAGVLGALNRIHHTAGLWHESPLLNAWGVFVAIVSAALVLLSATGIYLWFKLKRLRKSGALVLAAGLAYSLTLIILIRAA